MEDALLPAKTLLNGQEKQNQEAPAKYSFEYGL